MLVSECFPWIVFQALNRRLSGHFAGLSRRASPTIRPTKLQNDADLLDYDLRTVFRFKGPVSDIDLSIDEYNDLDQKAHDFLTSLDGMVNCEVIHRSAREETDDIFHIHPSDLTKINKAYPRLGVLLSVLHPFQSLEFNLVNGPRSLFFTPPRDDSRHQAMGHISAWTDFLRRLGRISVGKRTLDTLSQPQETSGPPEMPRSYVGNVMETILTDFQEMTCEKIHLIKLRMSEQRQINALEMLLSSCRPESGWHEAVCELSQATISSESNESKGSICTALQRTLRQQAKLRMLYQHGNLTISDSALPTSLHQYAEQGLSSLLDTAVFGPINPDAYIAGVAMQRFGRREKTALALCLARCLMDVFDDSLKLTACHWTPESVFLMESSETYQWHILIGPHAPGSKNPGIHSKIAPGNPVLLSFAKLLLEIWHGKKMQLDVDPHNIDSNLLGWARMCYYINEARQDGNNYYLEAVQGCLYLNIHLEPGDGQSLSRGALRRAIYQHIVCNLEKELTPMSRKRSPGDLLTSNHPKSKRVFRGKSGNVEIQVPLVIKTPPTNHLRPSYAASRSPDPCGHVAAALEGDACPAAPKTRQGFEIGIICAKAAEYDAVCHIFDEYWDGDGDRYGRAPGDYNHYTPGRIGKHNVVLALVETGKANAAAAAANLRSSYSGLEMALLVGTCGGVPQGEARDEIMLGDVVMSRSVVQSDLDSIYDCSRPGRRDTTDHVGRATKNIRSLLRAVETTRGHDQLETRASAFLMQLQDGIRGRTRGKPMDYSYPGTSRDKLFEADYRHKHRRGCTKCADDMVCEVALNSTCRQLGCDEGYLVARRREQETQGPAIHIGAMASGDMDLTSGEDRDRLAAEGVIGFETEGAGMWEELPCVIVKGVRDYADAHGDGEWRHYAAAAAAAATRALLERYPRTDREA